MVDLRMVPDLEVSKDVSLADLSSRRRRLIRDANQLKLRMVIHTIAPLSFRAGARIKILAHPAGKRREESAKD